MNSEDLNKILFPCDLSVRKTMELMNLSAKITHGRGFAMIVGDGGECIGVVTDGDIRHKLTEGASMDEPIAKLMNRNFIFAKSGDSEHSMLRKFEEDIYHLPVLDEEGKPLRLFHISDFDANLRRNFRVIRSRAPARISFSGGGTDMSYYFKNRVGYVLSTAINKYCYCSVEKTKDSEIFLVNRNFKKESRHDLSEPIDRDDPLSLVKACVKVMNPDFGFRMETRSEVDPGSGLGGSSALSATVIGALDHFRNRDHLDRYNLVDLAYQAERVELNVAGGWQDQCAAVFGGMNLIEFRKDEIVVVPLKLPQDLILELRHNLLLFRFGGTRDSGCIISDARQKFEKKKEEKVALYESMTNLTLQMRDALLKGRLQAFGQLLDEGWNLKKQFSPKISNDGVNSLYSQAKKAGALGAKVLGAGASGYFLVYAENGSRSQVVEAMEQQGASLEHFDLATHGIETWTALA
jgi:D-glycero-alpha-D-manno-heptose-7-phosphate kinase